MERIEFLHPSEEEREILKKIARKVREAPEEIFENFYSRMIQAGFEKALSPIFRDPVRLKRLKRRIREFLVSYLEDPTSARIRTRIRRLGRIHSELKIHPSEFPAALLILWEDLRKHLTREEERVLTRAFFLLSAYLIQVHFLNRERVLRSLYEQVRRLNRIYALLREVNLLIFEEREDPGRLFPQACDILVHQGGFYLAAVFMREEEGGEVRLVGASCAKQAPPECLSFLRSPEFRASEYLSRALTQKSPFLLRETEGDLPVLGPGKPRALLALPLELEGPQAILLVGDAKSRTFPQEEVLLLQEIARDLSLGYLHITKSRELERVIFRDDLTGLPNRRYLLSALEHELGVAQKEGLSLALVLLDLDHFFTLNASLGHRVGDQILREIGRRLSEFTLPSRGTVARVGPDEFAFSYLLRQSDRSFAWLKDLEDLLSAPYRLEDREIRLTVSMGVALSEGFDSPEDLFAAAEIALQEARKEGPGRVAFYSPELTRRVYHTLDLVRKLEKALEREEFLLYFQPRIDLRRREVVSFEALLRWEDPERGIVPPGEFIPVLEDTGLIVEVGAWVVKEVARFLARLDPSFRASFNVSARQFQEASRLVSAIEEALSETGLPGERLEMEITENLLVAHGAEEVLREIQNLGLLISLDDFGTGYSSLAYLRRFPVHSLKIDYSFVKGVPQNVEDSQVVMAIVSLAHNLNKRAVAEGVERKDQLAFLLGLGVDEIQGFLCAPPLPPEDFLLFVREFDPKSCLP